MISAAAKVFGAGLIVVGVLGFAPDFANGDALHNGARIVGGIVAILAGFYGHDAARLYFKVFGAVYGLAALLSFVSGFADSFLYIGAAMAALYFGFGLPRNRKSDALGRRTWSLYVGFLCVVALGVFVVEGFGRTFVRTEPVEASCSSEGKRIVIEATSDGFNPEEIKAQACDVLVFQNKTDGLIEIAFGNHNHHLKYPGLTGGITKSGEEKLLPLTKKGTYLVHDHLNDAHHATLTVE